MSMVLTDNTGRPLSRTEVARELSFGGATSSHVQVVDPAPVRTLDLTVWDRPTGSGVTAEPPEAATGAEPGDEEIDDDEVA